MKKKKPSIALLALSFLLPVSIIMMMGMKETARADIVSRSECPCDIYDAAGTPCVAAHSTTRALYKDYSGLLYQVMRQSDGKTLDIGVIQAGEGDAGGYADAAAQDSFCADTLCVITTIYDQSEKGNHLYQAPPGTFKGPARGEFNTLPIADMAPITINGHKAYGVYIIPGMGFRNNNASELAINDEPEGIYYVINGKHYDSGCCFDYGNSSTNGRAVGTGTMETTYYGTATAWGSGNGPGPWIMADMEAGLFSGYNAKQNDVPTIDTWNFVTVMVNGGGGNKWDLRGGNAQEGDLTTFYSGVRPGTPESEAYYPMSKKGGILLGNGGDNGNGSAGTFYEGVMTKGYPTIAASDAVHANIVAARYDIQRVDLSRLISFTPGSEQEIIETFTNTSDLPVSDINMSLTVPKNWSVTLSGSAGKTQNYKGPLAPDTSVSTGFRLTSPDFINAGYVTGNVEWKSQTGKVLSERTSQRVRNVSPVKINEVRFNTSGSSTDQFIELYNASYKEIDISGWKLVSTQSGWAPVDLVTIPENTKLESRGFYLLGLSQSGLAAPANKVDKIINIQSIADFEVDGQIEIGGENCTIRSIGTPASAKTNVFIPVSTGPWLTIPAGSTNLPVTNADGFEKGHKIGIDMGGNYEIATVTSVGKAGTQTNLSEEVKAGETIIKVDGNSNMSVGDRLTISTGSRKEVVTVKKLIKVVEPPAPFFFGQRHSPRELGEIELTAPLRFSHMKGVDVSDVGTGISFTPATRFEHKSGDAVQALGSGLTLKKKLGKNHEAGSAVTGSVKSKEGYQGLQKPDQWFGLSISETAGSIALYDKAGKVLIDGMVYGSQQSSSSANGTVASPEIATLEGDQSQGGCIVVVPGPVINIFFPVSSEKENNKSVGRFPDGADMDQLCEDFNVQNSASLLIPAKAGSKNIKIDNVEKFNAGEEINIGTGADGETAIIANIGTPGGTTLISDVNKGTTVIPVSGIEGFRNGQSITIDKGNKQESVTIESVIPAPFYFGNPENAPDDSLKLSSALKFNHKKGTGVSGSGIEFVSPLTRDHNKGSQVSGNLPTPGKPNQF